MGFYSQPPDIQLDLLAYWMVCQDPDAGVRFALSRPSTLGDEAHLHLLRAGKRGRTPALRKVGRDRYQGPGPAVMPLKRAKAKAKKLGFSDSAVSFWLTPDRTG